MPTVIVGFVTQILFFKSQSKPDLPLGIVLPQQSRDHNYGDLFFSEDSRSQVWYRNLVIYCWSAHSPCYKPGCQTLTFTWLGACTRRVTTAQLMQKCLHLWDRTCESFAWKTRLNIIFTSEDFVPSRKGLENGVLLWDTDPHPLHLHPSPMAGPGTCQVADFFPLEWKFFSLGSV